MIRPSSSKTSTCSSRGNPEEARLIVEATDFGYGPAHVLVAAFEGWDEAPPLTIVSSGNAARFLHQQLPGAELIELDCARPENWPAFLELIPTGGLGVTMSRPLAEFVSRAGCRIGLIDQLDWMWQDGASWERLPAFHIVQAYFGRASASPTQSKTVVGPIVAAAFSRTASTGLEPETAVIGFGGMAMLGRRDATDSYAAWILAKALPVLLEESASKRVAVIGGREQLASLVPAAWRDDPRLEVVTACPPAEYAELLRTSSHQLLTPGLATIYECAKLGIAPLLGPGYNKSMLLQLDDLVRTGYREIARWPWHFSVVPQLRALPQPDALALLGRRIEEAISPTGGEEWLTDRLRKYVEHNHGRAPLMLGPDGYPDAIATIRATIRSALPAPD